MDQIINDTTAKQLILYSAHDTTVASMLAGLNLTSYGCLKEFYINKVNNTDTCLVNFPPFASNLIF